MSVVKSLIIYAFLLGRSVSLVSTVEISFLLRVALDTHIQYIIVLNFS